MPKTTSVPRKRSAAGDFAKLREEIYHWSRDLRTVFDAGLGRYRQKGKTDGAESIFAPEEVKFLAFIGHTAQEFYDFVDDHVRYDGEPDWETILLIAAVRRDYFLQVQRGVPSTHVLDMDALPSKDAELDGVGWLPRLIEKARAKLRGEMPADLMYDCGGDRKFFRQHDLHPADFLRQAWDCDFDPARLLAFVRGTG